MSSFCPTHTLTTAPYIHFVWIHCDAMIVWSTHITNCPQTPCTRSSQTQKWMNEWMSESRQKQISKFVSKNRERHVKWQSTESTWFIFIWCDFNLCARNEYTECVQQCAVRRHTSRRIVENWGGHFVACARTHTHNAFKTLCLCRKTYCFRNNVHVNWMENISKMGGRMPEQITMKIVITERTRNG